MNTLPFLKFPGFTPTSCLTVAAIGSVALMPLASKAKECTKGVDTACDTACEVVDEDSEGGEVRIIELDGDVVVTGHVINEADLEQVIELADPIVEGPVVGPTYFDGHPPQVQVQVEPIAKEEVAPVPAKPVEGLEIVRPIGRVAPVEDAEPQTEAIPEKHAEHKEIAIVFEDLERVGERLAMRASLRIINPTDKPITFTGYSETSPIIKEQHWKDGKWVENKKILRCGTGLRQCTIAPGQSAVFKATVHAETMPTRIGIAYKGEGKELKTVWSPKIER